MEKDDPNTSEFIDFSFIIRIFVMFIIPLGLSELIMRFGSALSDFTLFIAGGIIVVISFWPRLFRQEASVVAFSVGLTAYFLAPSEISQIKFYELSAQIAPVLFLTLAIETRTFYLNPMGSSEVIAKVMIVIVLAYAEFESLRVIVIDRPESGNFDIVAAGLTAAAVLLILGGLVGLQSGARDSG